MPFRPLYRPRSNGFHRRPERGRTRLESLFRRRPVEFVDAIEAASGNLRRAAHLLACSRSGLYYLLDRHTELWPLVNAARRELAARRKEPLNIFR